MMAEEQGELISAFEWFQHICESQELDEKGKRKCGIADKWMYYLDQE